MAGFEAPTINDFLGQLYMQTERAIRDFQKGKIQIDATCSKAGMLQSSRRVLLILDAVDEHIEKGVSTLLGELRRAVSCPELDPFELRNLIGPRLDELSSGIIAAGNLEQVSRSLQSSHIHELIKMRIEKTRNNVLFWLRQFDIGWDEPIAPEPLKPPPNSR